MIRIVAVAGDPGGANALAPVLDHLLRDSRVELRCHAYRQAESLWHSRGLDCHHLGDKYSQAEIKAALIGSDLLLTGTSCNGVDWEKYFIVEARSQKIPSLAVLDFWSNYLSRFTLPVDRLCLPDRVAIMDKCAMQEMLEQGIDPSHLTITGQPAFDCLNKTRQQFTSIRRNEIRSQLKAKEDTYLVCFASQPLTEMYQAMGMDSRHRLGYDEREVREMLVAELERLASSTGKNIILALLPHPREALEIFSGLRSQIITISTVEKISAHELVMASDVVVGMNSVLLVEACYLGCPVLSIQPNLVPRDALPTNRAGYSLPAYSRGELRTMLEQMLLSDKFLSSHNDKLAELELPAGAAQQVVNLIHNMLEIER